MPLVVIIGSSICVRTICRTAMRKPRSLPSTLSCGYLRDMIWQIVWILASLASTRATFSLDCCDARGSGAADEPDDDVESGVSDEPDADDADDATDDWDARELHGDEPDADAADDADADGREERERDECDDEGRDAATERDAAEEREGIELATDSTLRAGVPRWSTKERRRVRRSLSRGRRTHVPRRVVML